MFTAGGQEYGAAALVGAGGEQVSASDVKVLSINEDDGFFVGISVENRVYVEFGGDVGENETAADHRPSIGDSVDLRGEIRPAPDDPGRTLRLEQDGSQLVKEQGAFINATNVMRGS